MHKQRIGIAAVIAAFALLIGASASFAAHSGGNVTLKNAWGTIVSSTEPYSPKQSCGQAGTCHPGGTATTGGHNYGSGTKFSTHVQGVIEGDNKVYWQAYQTKSFEHGVSVGRHSNQGRNEDYSNAQRTTYGDPFFTSSPGMFGKY